MQPPVRLYVACIALASMMMFTGMLSWGRSDRIRKAEAAALQQSVLRARALAAHTTPQATRPVTKPPASTGNPEPQAQNKPTPDPERKHTVQQGDSMWELASRYSMDLEDMLQANKNVDPGHLQIGQELVIPPKSRTSNVARGGGDGEDAVPALGGKFIWPVSARVSSTFGPRDGRNHNGIDLAANQGEPVIAARDGEVLLAGSVPGYGETVVLQHIDGTRTLYAHCSKLLVRAGQSVKQGEVIARVGSTGRSTGPHLHFEIIVKNRAHDPLLYLPKR